MSKQMGFLLKLADKKRAAGQINLADAFEAGGRFTHRRGSNVTGTAFEIVRQPAEFRAIIVLERASHLRKALGNVFVKRLQHLIGVRTEQRPELFYCRNINARRTHLPVFLSCANLLFKVAS